MLETTAQTLIQAMLINDMDAIRRLVTEDVTFEVIGRSPIAGMHAGRENLIVLCQRMHQHRQQYTYREQISETIAQGNAVIMLMQVATEREGQKRYWNAVQVLHFREGQADWGTMYLSDQYAFDEYWAA